MNEAVTITMIATPAGAWLVTSGVLQALEAQFGTAFKKIYASWVSLLLPIILIEVGTYASQAATQSKQNWILYFLAFWTALLAGKASANDRNAVKAANTQ